MPLFNVSLFLILPDYSYKTMNEQYISKQIKYQMELAEQKSKLSQLQVRNKYIAEAIQHRLDQLSILRNKEQQLQQKKLKILQQTALKQREMGLLIAANKQLALHCQIQAVQKEKLQKQLSQNEVTTKYIAELISHRQEQMSILRNKEQQLQQKTVKVLSQTAQKQREMSLLVAASKQLAMCCQIQAAQKEKLQKQLSQNEATNKHTAELISRRQDQFNILRNKEQQLQQKKIKMLSQTAQIQSEMDLLVATNKQLAMRCQFQADQKENLQKQLSYNQGKFEALVITLNQLENLFKSKCEQLQHAKIKLIQIIHQRQRQIDDLTSQQKDLKDQLQNIAYQNELIAAKIHSQRKVNREKLNKPSHSTTAKRSNRLQTQADPVQNRLRRQLSTNNEIIAQLRLKQRCLKHLIRGCRACFKN